METNKVGPDVPASQPLVSIATRKLVDTDLESIAARYLHLTVEPFERMHRLADASLETAAELERMEYELGLDAEAIRAAPKPGANDDSPIMPPLAEARHVASEQGFNAPEGSKASGTIARAIRIGMERGYARAIALSERAIIPSVQNAASIRKTITIREAVDTYVKQRDLPTKSISEVSLALRLFESVVGNKSLDSIHREDMTVFILTSLFGPTAIAGSRTRQA